MRRFKGVLVSRNSALGDALARGEKKEAEKIYAETTKRYEAQYSQADRDWFAAMSQRWDKAPVAGTADPAIVGSF